MTVWTRADLKTTQVSRGHWLVKAEGEAFDLELAGTTTWLVFRSGEAAPILRAPSLEAAEDGLVGWFHDHREGLS